MKTTPSPFLRMSLVLALCGTPVLLGGCVSSHMQTVYTTAQANRAFRVQMGTVVGVREVVIEGAETGVGRLGGAAIGVAATSDLGSGAGGALARAAGIIGGMVIGREVEKAATRRPGLEIHIELDNGQQIVVVQDAREAGFEDGDRVRVMMGQGTTIVAH